MDLKSLSPKKAAEAGFEVTLVHPATGEELPVKIRVMGTDSGAYQDMLAKQNGKRLDRLRRTGKRAIPSEKELMEETIERAAACTLGWTADEKVSFGGKPLPPFSLDAARELYADDDTRWILEQVDAAMASRANFFKDSATS